MKIYLLVTIIVLECGNNWILAYPNLVNSKLSRDSSVLASVFKVENVHEDNGKSVPNSEMATEANSDENSILHNDQWLIKKNARNSRIGRTEINATPSPLVPSLTRPSSIPEPSNDLCKDLPKELIDEIQGYQDLSNKIIQTVISGAFKGRTYKNLGYFVDKFGSRVAGSDNLEHAIDFMLDKMQQDELDNVHGENVTIPHWVRSVLLQRMHNEAGEKKEILVDFFLCFCRGEEKATLISPRVKDISILGLGYSVGTTQEGITAPVLVVSGFEELKNRASEVK